ncbi:MAG TPA: CBS domain-containing protein [Gemmataceae bacterium]|nr:CBS domain-containing protein [Gemmataceae bacterium]
MQVSTTNRIEAPLVLHAHTAADLMIPNPISIRAEAGINEAMAMFTEKGITAAPVIDEAGHPIGVVSRSDLFVHQCEHERHRFGKADYFIAPTFDSQGSPIPKATTTVADVMTPAVFAVAPETPVKRVVNDMVGLHVHRLFVVDADGVLVGVVSAMDVIKRLKAES